MEPMQVLEAIRADVAQIKNTLIDLLPGLEQSFDGIDDKLDALGEGVTAIEKGAGVTVNVNTADPFAMPGADGDDLDQYLPPKA